MKRYPIEEYCKEAQYTRAYFDEYIYRCNSFSEAVERGFNLTYEDCRDGDYQEVFEGINVLLSQLFYSDKTITEFFKNEIYELEDDNGEVFWIYDQK